MPSFTSIRVGWIACARRLSYRRLLLPFFLLGLPQCESEADRVEALIGTLSRELPLQANEARDARAKRLRREFASGLDSELEVEAPWLEGTANKSFAMNAAIGLGDVFPLTHLELTDVAVTLSESAHHAHARGLAQASASQPGDLHGFELSFTADLSKQGQVWRVKRLELSQPNQPLPEARP